jgi:subtilisin family serine protease
VVKLLISKFEKKWGLNLGKHKMNRRIFISALVFFIFCSISLAKDKVKDHKPNYKKGELIVRFQQDQLESAVSSIMGGPLSKKAIRQVISNEIIKGVKVTRTFDKIVPGLTVVKLPPNISVEEAILKFQQSGLVLYAEPNFKYQLYQANPVIPDDEYFLFQWPLNNEGQTGGLVDADIDAPEAWVEFTGDANNIIVAVLDTGISTGIDFDNFHPDLIDTQNPGNILSNMWVNPGEDFPVMGVPDANDVNEVDDDGNNYIDDIIGWDFAGDSFEELTDGDNDPTDPVGHGTQVAGIIGAIGNNGLGISGVAWDVNMMSVKVIADDGADEEDGIQEIVLLDVLLAMEYVISWRVDGGEPVKIINASWGQDGIQNFSQGLYDSIAAARDADILFVTAAGNSQFGSSNDFTPVFPASYGDVATMSTFGLAELDNIISVMATDMFDSWASDYSNFGSSSVDLAAPGGDLTPDEPGGVYTTSLDPEYAFVEGTSFAAAHVSGAAALIWAFDPNLTYQDVKQLILLGVDKLPSLSGLCATGGRLNLYKTLNFIIPGIVKRGRGGALSAFSEYEIQTMIDRSDVEDGDEVIAEGGRYYFENIDFKGKNIIVRSGDIETYVGNSSDLSENNTFISGTIRADTREPLVSIKSGENENAVLAGFTVSNSNAGGIYCQNSSPVITQCNISGNSNYHSDYGGGIQLINSPVFIDDCNIFSNSAIFGGGISCMGGGDFNIHSNHIYSNSANYGGGIYAEGTSDLVIMSNAIYSNNSFMGGAVYLEFDSSSLITNNSITYNSAGYGGGISASVSDVNVMNNHINNNFAWIKGGGLFADLWSGHIEDCDIIGNSASGGNFDDGGGGIFLLASEAVVNRCLVSNNRSEFQGGGIHLDSSSSSSVLNTRVTGNSAFLWGGGLYCYNSDSFIKNCLFTNNSADNWDGAGVYLEFSSPQILNSTIADNSTSSNGIGGGMMCFDGSNPVITDCIISGNQLYGVAIYRYEASQNNCVLDSNPVFSYTMFYDNLDGDYVIFDECDGIFEVYTGAQDLMNAGLGTDLYDDNPMFVTGRLGNYYLSQWDAGQRLDVNGVPTKIATEATSPAVDAGSDFAINLLLHRVSTRTNNIPDGLEVDLGYHYDDDEPLTYFELELVVVPFDPFHPVATLTPDRAPDGFGGYIQYSHVILTAELEDDSFQFRNWSGTDDDSKVDYDPYPAESPSVIQINLVTMTSGKNVFAIYEEAYVQLITSVSGESGTIIPFTRRPKYYRRGVIVSIQAIPDNPSHVVIWSGTDDDHETSFQNQVTMLDNPETVNAHFYAPQTIHIPGDYTNLQEAIDNASSRDIIESSESGGVNPYISEDGYFITRAVTITSTHPDDPDTVANTVFEMTIGPDGSAGTPFLFMGVGRDAVLNGLTVRGGPVGSGNWWGAMDGLDPDPGADPPIFDGGSGSTNAGGAIYCSSASPTIKNCVISEVRIQGGNGVGGAGGNADHPNGGNGGWPGGAHGGGVSIGFPTQFGFLPGSNPLFSNCTFDECVAQGGNGGDGGGAADNSGGWGGRGGGYYYNFVPSPWEFGPFIEPYKYSGLGGAVFVGPGNSAEFRSCSFIDCESRGGFNGICGTNDPSGTRDEPSLRSKINTRGGAVFCDDNSSVKFIDCQFIDNDANTNPLDPAPPPAPAGVYTPYVSFGGAVAFEDTSTVQFENCTFNGNQATVGGAAYWSGGNHRFTDSSFVGNIANQGGGILFSNGTSEFLRCDFSNNTTAAFDGGDGGGMSILGANALILDSDFSNNTAESSGGGIYLSNKDLSGQTVAENNTVLIKNTLITNNTANRDGAGISANWYSDPNIVNCTIADNVVTGTGQTQGYGGGISSSYGNYTKVTNSIIWGNRAELGGQISIRTDSEFDPRPSTVGVSYSSVGPRFTYSGGTSSSGSGQSQTSGSGAIVIDGQTISDQFDAGAETVKIIVSLYEPVTLRAQTNWKSPSSVDALRAEITDRQTSVLSTLSTAEFTLNHKYVNQAAFSGEVTLDGLDSIVSNSLVQYVEPVRYMERMLAQSIPLANGTEARQIYDGTGVAVAIVDDGIDYTHPMLGGGGFPNTKVLGGYDFGDMDADPAHSLTDPLTGHGTAVSGIAAGALGFVGDYIGGVAFNSKIYALKVFNENGFMSTDSAIAAWDWCITNQNADPANPIMVINNSWGSDSDFYNDTAAADQAYPGLANSAQNAVNAGITILAASGNEYQTDGISVPAALTNVISVGAVYDTTDEVTEYSNTADILDILAPADPMYTTDMVGTPGYDPGNYVPNFNGTSSSSPFAAGVVALIQSASGIFLTPGEVRNLLVATGDNVTDTKVAITKPRVNIGEALDIQDTGPIYIEEGSHIENGWWDPETLTWDSESHNLSVDDDPCFVTGPQGAYYLSQVDAGQDYQSLCVDAGNADAHEIGMYRHTTRTDNIIDDGIVDMGCHYLLYTSLVGDFNYDGYVDFCSIGEDLQRFLWHWLDSGCGFPDYCHEKDLNLDGIVNFLDMGIAQEHCGESDATPPEPDPMTWETPPFALNSQTVSMTATQAVDEHSGFEVEYYFECVTGPGNDSGWITNRTYNDTVEETGQYCYRVKASDYEEFGNETDWSQTVCVTVTEGGGQEPDAPNPPSNLNAIAVSSVQIDLTWTDNSNDESGFRIERSDDGGATFNQIAQVNANITNYSNLGLQPVTTYSYRVRAYNNDGNSAYSNVATATTLSGPPPDDQPPLPNPAMWLLQPQETLQPPNLYVHSMTAAVADDTLTGGNNPCQYYFQCYDNSSFDSGWQLSNFYSVPVSSHTGIRYRWRFRTRDAVGNVGQWSTLVWVQQIAQ